MRLVNLGCGTVFHPDWENYDLCPSDPAVRHLDLLNEWPFEEESCDAVYHSHVLEHMPRGRVPGLLARCREALRAGGVIRIAVPDLEGICRDYLKSLDAARRGKRGADVTHEWMTIELIDQMVRNVSGGAMGRLWASRPLEARETIVRRMGPDAEKWIDFFEERYAAGKAAPEPKRLFLDLPDPSVEEEAAFRQEGEVHRWMYDEVSLGKLLEGAGFGKIRRRDARSSAIPRFDGYRLDRTEAGVVRKPDSLFMEAERV